MLSQESSVTLKAFCLILGTHTFDLSATCYSFCEYCLCTADSGPIFVELNYSVLEIRETGLFQPRSLRHYLRGMCASLLRAIQALLGKLAPPRRPNTNTGAQRHPNLKSLLERLAAFSPQNKLAGGKLVSGL